MNSEYVGQSDVGVFYPGTPPSAEAKHGHPGDKPRPVTRLQEGETYQVLWLLHGSGGNFSHWPLLSMVMEKCEKAGLVTVMPTVLDFVGGQPDLGDFFRYISEELPMKLGNILPVSGKREDNFICGLSYGGYLAYRAAFTHPQRYGCVGSLSSPLDVLSDIRDQHQNQYGYPSVEEVRGTDRDLFCLAEKAVREKTELPKLFQACGTEDFTWEYNRTALEEFRRLGLDPFFVSFPGDHNFAFWNDALLKFLEWIPYLR